MAEEQDFTFRITRSPEGTKTDVAPRQEPTESFRWLRSHHDKVLEYQFALGRWIMASLLLLNGAGLIGILNVSDKLPKLLAAAPYLAWGSVLAVLSGALAWINCNLIVGATDLRSDFEKGDYQESEDAEVWDKWAVGTGLGSVVVALLSLGAFGGGIQAAKGALDDAASAVVAYPSAQPQRSAPATPAKPATALPAPAPQ